MSFRALVTDRDGEGAVSSGVRMLEEARLPEGDVTVAVEWAGFNYKDGLVLTGRGGLVRDYPHVGGIDFAGRVVRSTDHRFHPGRAVILTGWGVGERRWGGFAERARVQADWLVPLPRRLSTRDAMVLGTAGLTAMLAANRLHGHGLRPGDGEVLVTGAGGGVGSLSVLVLSRLGFEVTALTGRPALAPVLGKLGAARVIGREALGELTDKPLESGRWAGVVDVVGGALLAQALKQLRPGGAAAAVGLAGDAGLPGSVLPFILRGVTLYGIDSVTVPLAARVAAWDRLADLYVPAAYAELVEEAELEALPAAAERILEGGIAGRLVAKP